MVSVAEGEAALERAIALLSSNTTATTAVTATPSSSSSLSTLRRTLAQFYPSSSFLKESNKCQLTSIDLGGCRIGDAGVARLAAALAASSSSLSSSSTFASSLNLSDDRIGPAGARTIADMLRLPRLWPLWRLNVRANPLGDEGARAISLALGAHGDATLRQLNILDMSGAGIGDCGGCALADALRRTCVPLTDLDLSDNNLGDVGVSALANALSDTAAAAAPIAKLSLSSNSCGPHGAFALVSTIRHTRTLVTLSLCGNAMIGDDAVCAFADVLEDGNAWALDIGDTVWLFSKIGSRAAAVLRRFVRPGNRSMRHLFVGISVRDFRGSGRINRLLRARQVWK
jgi:hypothetical protein